MAPQKSGYSLAYSGGPLGFGTIANSTDLAGKASYPADGRGLPPGTGTYEQGKRVYQEKCLVCHGDKLQGVKGLGETLIGGRGTLVNNDPAKAPLKTIESYWPYATTVFDYIKRAMPFNAPGSLSDDEVYAVTAYLLGEANIIGTNVVINAQTLPSVRMPNRDGFIPDPRPDVP
ncbi:MAG: c-type cytochrome [Pyrinomonadaceae bacterium]